MESPRRWCWVTVVHSSGSELDRFELRGRGPPDLSVLDELARVVLFAKRLGCTVRLDEVAARLVELLELADLPLEVGRKAESGEETLRVEHRKKEAHPGDSTT